METIFKGGPKYWGWTEPKFSEFRGLMESFPDNYCCSKQVSFLGFFEERDPGNEFVEFFVWSLCFFIFSDPWEPDIFPATLKSNSFTRHS